MDMIGHPLRVAHIGLHSVIVISNLKNSTFQRWESPFKLTRNN